MLGVVQMAASAVAGMLILSWICLHVMPRAALQKHINQLDVLKTKMCDTLAGRDQPCCDPRK